MKKYRYMMWLSLAGLCLMAGGIRLSHLGVMDTRADEVWLLEFVKSDGGVGNIWNFRWNTFKEGRTMVLPNLTACALVKGFSLESNRFNVRLSYALMGILTIPVLFLLGLRLGDRRLAWILAFLGTINPYLVFYSREAHVYAFPLLFNTLAAAFAAGVIQALRRMERPRISDVVWLCVASVLACHSHMSSWPFVGLLWLLIFGLLITHRTAVFARTAARGIGLAFTVWIVLLLPWIWLFISVLFTAQESFLKGAGLPDFIAMWRLPFVMTWGGGLPRGIVTVSLLLAGGVGGLLIARWRALVAVTLIMGVIMFGVMSAMMYFGGGFFQLRYYSPLWLVFNLLGGLGLLLLAEWAVAGIRRIGGISLPSGAVAVGLCGVVAVCAAQPVYWILHLPGNPFPYSMINRWMDTNLPKGTLVIVDRWLEPWNEMKYHAPTNVIATFTIPSEPYDVMMKYNWPQTVKDFFKKYPDSAYLERAQNSPIIGRLWDWPRRHFRRHVVFTNTPAILLRQAVLAGDGWYSANTNGLIVDLFYNTREDAVEQARTDGQQTLVCYGPGWGYIKLWQQFRDFRDWRILEGNAALDVYNLTPQTNTVTLLIRGMAANGGKRVRFGMLGQADFQNLQLAEWRIERVPLKPGLNQFILTDALWSAAKIPLLVDQVEVVEAGRQTEEKGR